MSTKNDEQSDEMEDFLNETFLVIDEELKAHCSDMKEENESFPKLQNDLTSECKKTDSQDNCQEHNEDDTDKQNEDDTDKQNEDDIDKQDENDTNNEKNDVKCENELTKCDDESIKGQDELKLEDPSGDKKKAKSVTSSEILSDGEINETEDLETANEGVDSEEETDSHPYLYLIENFQFTKEQKTVTQIGPPKYLSETPLHVISTKVALMRLLQNLKLSKEIALDIRLFNKQFNYSVALMAISTRDADYIIDTIKLQNEILLLTEIFINPKIVKIVYKSDFILLHLQKCLHLFLINIFDVDKAAQALFGKKRKTLSVIMKEEFSFNRNAKLHDADFCVRPLPDDLQEYCQSSTHYLLHVYHNYKNGLLKKDERSYMGLLEEYRGLCKVLFPGQKVRQLADLEAELKLLHNCQLDALGRLYDWRNHSAELFNKSPETIASGSVLIHLATELPVSKRGICTLGSIYVRRDVDKVLDIINTCRKAVPGCGKKEKLKNEAFVGDPPAKETDKQTLKRKLNNAPEVGQNKQKRVETPFNKMENKLESVKNKQNAAGKKKAAPNFSKVNFMSFVSKTLRKPTTNTEEFRSRPDSADNARDNNFRGQKVLKPTNVPSNVPFQSNSSSMLNSNAFNRNSTFESSNRPFGMSGNSFGGFSTSTNRQKNFGNRYDYDQDFDSFDRRSNTLETNIPRFQGRNPNSSTFVPSSLNRSPTFGLLRKNLGSVQSFKNSPGSSSGYSSFGKPSSSMDTKLFEAKVSRFSNRNPNNSDPDRSLNNWKY